MAATYTRGSVYATSGSFTHGIGTGDFTFACWAYQTAANSYSCLWANGTYDPAFYMEAGGRPPIIYGLGGSDISFNTTLSLNTWYHLAARRSGTTITCWVNGVQEANTGTRSGSMPTAVQRIAHSHGSGAEGFTGRMAEAGLWSAALSSDEIGSLADGLSPLAVRPAALLFHYPLVRQTTQELIGGLTLTETGTVSIAAHPRIYMPHRTKARRFTTAVVAASSANMRTLLGVGT